MKESKLGHIAEPLREMAAQSEFILSGFKKSRGAKVLGYTCDFLPIEILSAAGIVPVRIPAGRAGGCCAAGVTRSMDVPAVYDYLVLPEGCGMDVDESGVPVYRFSVPPGYGAVQSSKFRESLLKLLRELNLPPLESIPGEVLASAVDEYNLMRRIVRGICSIRTAKPDLLSQDDLYSIMDASVSLPPGAVNEHCAGILKKMNDTASGYPGSRFHAVVHACRLDDTSVLDEIEDAGCLVVEDDTCNGRRQFDMSFNRDADDLQAEILNAYSYKPLCPSIRPVEERYELFYNLLKSYGIEMVIFITGGCGGRSDEVDYLRKKLMRLGVDPLVAAPENAKEEVAKFIARAGD